MKGVWEATVGTKGPQSGSLEKPSAQAQHLGEGADRPSESTRIRLQSARKTSQGLPAPAN